jgi:hypothetical protein
MCEAREHQRPDSFFGDAYKNARGQIEHENTLIGHRITWFLAFQGLLFTALFVLLGLLDVTKGFNNWQRGFFGAGALLLCVLGAGSAFVCGRLVSLAYGQLEQVRLWWIRVAGVRRFDFPPLYGDCDHPDQKKSQPSAGAEKLLYVICGVWVVLMVIEVGATKLAVELASDKAREAKEAAALTAKASAPDAPAKAPAAAASASRP